MGHSLTYGNNFFFGKKCGKAGNGVYQCESMWLVSVNVTVRTGYMHRNACAFHAPTLLQWQSCSQMEFCTVEQNSHIKLQFPMAETHKSAELCDGLCDHVLSYQKFAKW